MPNPPQPDRADGAFGHHQQPALRDYGRRHAPLGRVAGVIEIIRPAGTYSRPPSDDLLLAQPQTAGMGLHKVWGDARFDGVVPARSLWLVPPRVGTEVRFRHDHTIRYLSVTTDWLREALPERRALPDFGHLRAGPFFSPIVHHLSRALWHAAELRDGDRLGIDAMLLALVVELSRLAGEKPAAPSGGLAPWQVRLVTEAIAEHPATDLSLATLAGMVRLSPFHFARAFRASLGVPPHRYQKQLRIRRAAALLEDGGLSVTDVAMAVGYESGQALARAFRQETGISPRAWRRMRRD